MNRVESSTFKLLYK